MDGMAMRRYADDCMNVRDAMIRGKCRDGKDCVV